jgi:hypothetical protein
VEQVAEVESGSAIVRFRVAVQAPEVAAHSPAAVPVEVQLAPAVPEALPAWDVAVEVLAPEAVAAVEGVDSLEDTLTEKTRSDL